MDSGLDQARFALQRWCLDARSDDAFAIIELERLFIEHCQCFLDSRMENGFSLSTYAPKHAPAISIVDNSNFGAKAYIDGDRDTIEINEGTLSFIIGMSLKCVSNPLFSIIGQSDGQTISRRRFTALNSASLIGSYDIPLDPMRRAIAIELGFFAFLIVLFHEVGHLAQNHCRLIRGSACHDFGDDEKAKKSELSQNQIQSLEFMADLFSVRELMIYIQSVRDEWFPEGKVTRELSIQEMALYFCVGDQTSSQSSIFTALGIIFYLTSSSSRRHPDRSLRLLSTLLACKRLIPQGLGQEVKSADLLAGSDAIQLVSYTVAASIPIGEDFEHIANVLESPNGFQLAQNGIDTLRRDFLELRPHLQAFAAAEKAFIKFDDE